MRQHTEHAFVPCDNCKVLAPSVAFCGPPIRIDFPLLDGSLHYEAVAIHFEHSWLAVGGGVPLTAHRKRIDVSYLDDTERAFCCLEEAIDTR